MTLGECWRLATTLVVSDHAIERYFLRSPSRADRTGADVDELIRAEVVRSWGGRRHQRILELGAHPRLAVLWKTESLVTLIRPGSSSPSTADVRAPGASPGQPIALTILTLAMFDKSVGDGRYRRAA